ncbi:hypothetical protein PGT21_003948 [Puccinia graminis f. sp. tritici]|uniref:Uncharacterized protein n=1 Tax=Puccinia graminis f. sp. tritici TaxID=56615 RepID=A0A5B0MS60_PUCGR|nr:hypothetical protein PGT21_003948 [Puccinia graminis f. sp. tritici]
MLKISIIMLLGSALSYVLAAPVYHLIPATPVVSLPDTCPAVQFPMERPAHLQTEDILGHASSNGMHPADPQLTMDPPDYLPKEVPRKLTDEERRKIVDILRNYPPGHAYRINESPYPIRLAKAYWERGWDGGRVRVYDENDILLHDTGYFHFNAGSILREMQKSRDKKSKRKARCRRKRKRQGKSK